MTTGLLPSLPPDWWAAARAPSEHATAAGSDEQPGWADFVLAALAESPRTARVSDPPAPAEALDVFLPVVSVLLEHCATRLDARLDGLVSDDIAIRAQDLLQALGRRLTRLCARTLVRELHRAPIALAGADSRERFAGFVARTATPAGLAGLMARYPVLARLLGTACLSAIDAFAELAIRLNTDRAAVDELAGATRPVAAIELDTGDAHQGGRTVAIIRFACGAAVAYKPRPLDIQRHLGEILDWYSSRLPGLSLRTPVTVTRDGYGWSEFVTAAPCADQSGVERFYRRQGALLALLYALDCSDIHLENLIAAGDEPIVIDVETLFHPSLIASSSTGPDPAVDRLAASVARTGLLPIMVDGANGRLDVSGLGGGLAQLRPDDVVDWANAGTDAMRLVRRPAMSRPARNRPVVDGVSADPAVHLASLHAGFRQGYDAVLRGRAELLALVERCADDVVRVVVRDTRFYATVLDESTHPDVLADAATRDRLFVDALSARGAHPSVAALLADEVSDLWVADVPMFTARAGRAQVWTAQGVNRGALLPVAPVAAIAAKVASLGESDRFEQEWVLDASFAAREGVEEHRAVPAQWLSVGDPPDEDRLLSRACAIGDQLVASACGDGRRANWLGLELVDGRNWMLMPLGGGLGDGYCGVALFLTQLAELTGISRYRELAERCLVALPGLIERLAADADLAAVVGGGLSGFGGIAYALARMQVLLGEPALQGSVQLAVQACGVVADSADLSYGTGSAGALAALVSIDAAGEPVPGLDAIARRLADRLAGSDGTWDGPPGLLTGASGPAWALGRYAETTGDLQSLAAAALLAGRSTPREDDPSWCHGLAGHAVALAITRNATGDAAAAVGAIQAIGPLAQSSLCHGESGVLESLLVLSARGSVPATRALRLRSAALMGDVSRRGPRCGTPNGVATPGLLNGLAGIGYSILRLAAPAAVPSALFLDHPDHTPAPTPALPTPNQEESR